MNGIGNGAFNVGPLAFWRIAEQLHGDGALFIVHLAVVPCGQVQQRISAGDLHKVFFWFCSADFRAAHLEIQPPVFQGVVVADFCPQKLCHYTPLAFRSTVTPMRASTLVAMRVDSTPTSSPESMTT